MAVDLGLAFGSDPDWFVDLPREKRVQVMAWARARKEPELAMWSVHGLQGSDLVHLLSTVLGAKKGEQQDLVAGLLAQLDA